jgi:predicted AAA+ superfamily ATPase
MNYITRLAEPLLTQRLQASPAVILDGPRGVGKTTLAAKLANSVLNLEIPAIRALAQTQPDEVLRGQKPLFIDEWHMAPEIIGGVRRAVDADRTPGQFILAGSQPEAIPHSGVGRLSRIQIRPFTLQERGTDTQLVKFADLLEGFLPEFSRIDYGLKDYALDIVRSGFPAFHRLDEHTAREELAAYIHIMIASDAEAVGTEVRRPQLLHNWLRSYAACTATNSSVESIRKASGTDEENFPSKVTSLNYLDLLSRLRVIDPVEPFSLAGSPLQRVSGSIKHGLVDPGLACALMGVGSKRLLEGQLGSGSQLLFSQFFENLVSLHLKVFASLNQSQLSYYREWDGRREVDFIVDRPDGRVVLIEVKLGQVDDRDVAHLHYLADRLSNQVTAKLVITASGEMISRRDGVVVAPLAAIGF